VSQVITISLQYMPCTMNSTACTPTIISFVPVVPPEPIGARRDMADKREAEKMTPPTSALREMARKSPPPQEWWDEDFEGADRTRIAASRCTPVSLIWVSQESNDRSASLSDDRGGTDSIIIRTD
jgi:hypothetical protein